MKKHRSLERRNKIGGGAATPVLASLALDPLAQAPAGEFLKTRHWRVFLTEFHANAFDSPLRTYE
ncbi:MAG: hypothetical protein IJ113_02775 [Eggerthellaceae bacterium]|nr:hypothetical protein [Eggerthellaceae bacterium]